MTKKDKEIKKEIAELRDKVNELTMGWQRTQADFLNYKKQAEEDRQRLIKCANEELLSEILPVLDNFQLASKHLPPNLINDNWAQGIKQIEKQFENILFDFGLEKIAAIGQVFNPELHEAIEEINSNEKSGIITDEILSGYKYHNIVLRPSKVKVSK